jgi:hypothetical protein
MAEIKFLKLFTTIADSTAYSSSNYINAGIRLRYSDSDGSDNGEYTGNTVSSGNFTEIGNGYWYININENDSGLYRIEYYDNDASAWAYIDGAAPIKIDLTNYISKDIADTKIGNLNMSGYNLTAKNILLDTPSSLIKSGFTEVELQNIPDKAANEDITGNYNFTGGVKINGSAINVTAAELNKLDGINEIYDPRQGINRATVSPLTTNTNLTVGDNGGYVPVNVGDTAITLNLPQVSSSNAGVMFIIMQSNVNTNAVITIQAYAGNKMIPSDGTTTSAGSICTIPAKIGYGVVLMSSGSIYWYILGGAAYTLS